MNVLITGASRGIGLALAERFLRSGYSVIAAARNPDGARELWELEHGYPGRCSTLQLDVTSEYDLETLPKALGETPIDILINNAGILLEYDHPFERVSLNAMRKTFEVNVLGPLAVTQAMLPNLRLGTRRIVATLSSKMGSISDNKSGGSYAYRVSKAAVNMLGATMAKSLPDIVSVVLHPGWVKTEMGGDRAPVTTSDSAEGLYQVISGLTPKDSGQFFDFRGGTIPW